MKIWYFSLLALSCAGEINQVQVKSAKSIFKKRFRLLKKFHFKEIKTTRFFNQFFKILNSLMILRILEYVHYNIFNYIKGHLETISFKQTKTKTKWEKNSFFQIEK